MIRIMLRREELEIADNLTQKKLDRHKAALERYPFRAIPVEQALKLGTRAEYACVKYFGGHMNTVSVDEDLEGDNRIDFYTHGISCDVKVTEYLSGNLIFNQKEDFRADMAVLVLAGPSHQIFHIAGGISRKRFLKRHCRKDFGHGERYFVPQSWLLPADKILALLKSSDCLKYKFSSQELRA